MTVADYGINKLYERSDKRAWVIKCNHCGYDQILDYDKNIKQVKSDGVDLKSLTVQPGTFDFVCQKCGKSLDRWYSGRWEITNPGPGKIHGYNISQMNAVWVTADALKMNELRAPSKQFFYNYTLGFPFEDKSTTFHDYDVYRNIKNYERPFERTDEYKFVSSGIDWGEHNHTVVTVGMTNEGKIRLMDISFVPNSRGNVDTIEQDLNEVVRILNKYKPDIICPDIGFSGNYVDKLTAYYGMGRVYGVNVRSATSNGDYNAHFSDADGKVTIDKLTQNLILLSNIKRGDIEFWKTSREDPDIKTFIEHAQNVVFRTDEKENPQTHMVEYKRVILRKGGDHGFQTLVYAFVGLDKLMRDYSLTRQKAMEVSYLDPGAFNMEHTNIQEEYNQELELTPIEF